MKEFEQAQYSYECAMEDPLYYEQLDEDEIADRDAYFSEVAMERQLMEEERQVDSYCWG